jgi:hypothetical protein
MHLLAQNPNNYLTPAAMQYSNNHYGSGGGFAPFGGLLAIIGMWRVFSKAGEAGWKAIIPIYNIYILLKIIGKPWWWLLLLLIPFVNIVILVMMAIALGERFGKGPWWSFFLLAILAPIGLLILGFSGDKYKPMK